MTELLKLIAHPVNLLNVGEDHLGVYPPLLHHPRHVLRRQEVRNSGKLLSGRECKLKVFSSVRGAGGLQRSKVECIGEEVVNECAEGEAVSPGLSEVVDCDTVVLPGPTLAPDEDGLHLGAEGLLPDNPELQSQARVCRHSSTFAVWVQSWCGILDLLDEAGHVLEEEIVKVLLLHVPELEGGLAAAHHPDAVCDLL